MKTKQYEPKVIRFDIETAPGSGRFYDYRKEYNIVHVDQQPFLLSVAWQTNDEEKIHFKSIRDFKRKKLYTDEDDYGLCGFIHEELFSKADILVGHNGYNFDIKFVNGRLIKHRFQPPPPYKTEDTLKMSRSVANLPSHRLDYIARYYGIGSKLPHHGKDTWMGCLHNDDKEWATMEKYNKHDVYLLKEVHKLLQPWTKTYTNVNLYTEGNGCPRPGCGGTRMIKEGTKRRISGYVQQWRCGTCGGFATEYLKKEKGEQIPRIKIR